MSPQLKIIKGYLRTYHYLKYAANFRLGGRVYIIPKDSFGWFASEFTDLLNGDLEHLL